MVLATTGYCPIHGQQHFLNNECRQCRLEREQSEEERWNSLTTNEKLDELKRRLDNAEKLYASSGPNLMNMFDMGPPQTNKSQIDPSQIDLSQTNQSSETIYELRCPSCKHKMTTFLPTTCHWCGEYITKA